MSTGIATGETLGNAGQVRATDVVTFLRSALIDGPVAVSEIEKSARAAGLLGDRQDLTHAKRFKRAKANLGVQSVREGFGRDGEWTWALPPPAKAPAPEAEGHLLAEPKVPALQTEPELAATYGDSVAGAEPSTPKVSLGNDAEMGLPPEFRDAVGVPRSWLEGIARLNVHHHPRDVPAHRWREFAADCFKFVLSTQNWGERAADLGWDAFALFGCSPSKPLMYLGCAGLLWLVNGGRIVQLHSDWAEIAANGRDSSKWKKSHVSPATRRRYATVVVEIAVSCAVVAKGERQLETKRPVLESALARNRVSGHDARALFSGRGFP